MQKKYLADAGFILFETHLVVHLHPTAKAWRRVRVVEGARLESVYTGNCIKGSNPFVSALFFQHFFHLHTAGAFYEYLRIFKMLLLKPAFSLIGSFKF